MIVSAARIREAHKLGFATANVPKGSSDLAKIGMNVAEFEDLAAIAAQISLSEK